MSSQAARAESFARLRGTRRGTGRSYHADLGAKNQRLRVHYLLEPGWKADAAIQGLGRTNRTNQAQPPLFRPVATDVKAEKLFLSTIARRLDTLGAITRGQRQTGGQGLFRPEDNLESPYARDVRNGATTYFHSTGACRMGSDDTAVVDPQLLVNGIRNLQIADSTIMPWTVTVPTMPACAMIGVHMANLLA